MEMASVSIPAWVSAHEVTELQLHMSPVLHLVASPGQGWDRREEVEQRLGAARVGGDVTGL